MITRFWSWANTPPGNPEPVTPANMGQSLRLIICLIITEL